MNKSKIFLLAAVTALAGGALVGVASFTKTNSAQFAKASIGDPVAHTIVFGNQHITEFVKNGNTATSKLKCTTDAGNEFKSYKIEMYDSTAEGPSRGGQSNTYIYLIHNKGWREYIDNNAYFYAEFELLVDVADSVDVFATITSYYDDGITMSAHTENVPFHLEDYDQLYYEATLTYKFGNKNYEYLTVDSITVKYSCTY